MTAGLRSGLTPGRRPGRWPGIPDEVACGVHGLRRTLHAAISEEEVKELGRALLRKAKAGDVAACKLLLSYLVGLPAAPAPPPPHPRSDKGT